MPETLTSSPAYDALRACARKRIEDEWKLTGREKRLLNIIARLSFGCSQLFACIPKQEQLAQAAQLHKSDASRLLKRLILRGCLSFRRHRGETLYRIELFDGQVSRREHDAVAAAALEALVQIQQLRHNGQADATGQVRLPGILGPTFEDGDLERMAMMAMSEESFATAGASTPAPVPLRAAEPLQEPQRPVEQPARREDLEARSAALEGLISQPVVRGEIPQGDSLEVAQTLFQMPDRPRGGMQINFDAFKTGLTHEEAHLWDCLITEFRRGGTEAMKDFAHWAGAWKNRLKLNPHALYEAVASHKLRRTPARTPGAYMLNEYDVITGKKQRVAPKEERR